MPGMVLFGRFGWRRTGFALLAVWSIPGLLAWGGSVLSALAEGGAEPTPLGKLLVSQLLIWWYWVPVTLLVELLRRRWPIGKPLRWLPVVGHLSVSLVLAAIHALYQSAVYMAWIDVPQEWLSLARRFGEIWGQFDVLTYWGILGALTAIDYYQRFQEREARAARLEAELARAELDSLKMQLQPHFLFNSLQAVATLIEESPVVAARVVTRLGDLLRLTLERSGIQEVSLRQELEFLEAYLDIQQQRFESRIRVTLEVQPNTLDLLVPNLVLQPLVENAVKHAVEARSSGGQIVIGAAREGNRLVLTVDDDGPGISHTGPGRAGIGLANTRARLERLYGEDQHLELQTAPAGGLRVRLAFPARAATIEGPIG